MPAADWNNLENLDSLDDQQLAPKFISKTEEFLQYVLDSTKLKSVCGIKINGRREFQLVESRPNKISRVTF